LGILFGGKWFDYQALKQEEKALDDSIAAAFKEALPGSRMVRPKSQIRQALEAAGGGNTGGFIQTLDAITESLSVNSDTVIRSIAVRDGRFDLDITTDALPTLDLFKAELAKRDLTLTVLSANRDKEGLRSRLRVE